MKEFSCTTVLGIIQTLKAPLCQVAVLCTIKVQFSNHKLVPVEVHISEMPWTCFLHSVTYIRFNKKERINVSQSVQWEITELFFISYWRIISSDLREITKPMHLKTFCREKGCRFPPLRWYSQPKAMISREDKTSMNTCVWYHGWRRAWVFTNKKFFISLSVSLALEVQGQYLTSDNYIIMVAVFKQPLREREI